MKPEQSKQLKRAAVRTNPKSGQAILVMVLALGIFMFAALGLGLDGAQLYAHHQMAQAAADASAEAAIMSIFDGTNSTSAHPFATGVSPAPFVCTVTDLRIPCVYARNNGFGATASDTVTVSFPATASGVTLSSDTVPLVQVLIQRTLPTTLMKFAGKSSTVVQAKALAAIAMGNGPVPMLITHPTLSAAIALSNNPSIRVCGGPPKSIQVNSKSATAVSGGSYDLSHAGPNDPGNCTTGTGGSFGVAGGPAVAPAGLLLGSAGAYIQPASPILDPFASVPAPAVPANAPAKTALANGVSGCPALPQKSCNLYSPGYYASGISVKNETAVFKPGLYYIGGGGFGNAANGVMLMSSGFAPDAATGAGMVIYNSGTGTLGVGANSDATLTGSDATSQYKGVLFFQDRTASAQTHTLGGGGNVVLTGAIYLTNSLTTMRADSSHYQSLSMGGNSSITINGTIVVDALSMNGTPRVTYNLAASPTVGIRQVALIE